MTGDVPVDAARRERDNRTMGDPLDFYLDEGGWPYPDDDGDEDAGGPVDERSLWDDDLVALHAVSPHLLDDLSDDERAVVVARFGLAGGEPMTMAEVAATLGLSPWRARGLLAGGIASLRSSLGEAP
jgi:RNA polymerase nonessential primary-like sigma factor